ncbi:MAG: DUF5667 domain-containing protein [Patescibacteria group bacterium]|jgi:hypothetical protein
MSNYPLLKKIREIRIVARRTKPDAAWVVSTRSTLLMQVKNSMPVSAAQKSSIIKEWFNFFGPVFSFGKWLRAPAFSIAAIIVALFGGSLFSVSAAERSLPGDLLYSVKIATEQAQLAMASSPERKLKLKTEFTDRRVDEMKQVVAAPAANRGNKIIQTAETLKRDMRTIKQQLGDMQTQSSPQTVKESAKIVDEKTNAVVQALQETKDSMTLEERVKVTEAQVAASDTSVSAIEVLADTHKTDGDVVTAQDVVDVVKSHNEAVAKTMAQAVGLNPNSVTSTVSMPIPATNTTMTSSTAAVIVKVGEAQKTLTEADQLVTENKIDEAVVKIKLGTQQAFDAQRTVEQSDIAQANAVNGADAALVNATSTGVTATSTSSTPQTTCPGCSVTSTQQIKSTSTPPLE